MMAAEEYYTFTGQEAVPRHVTRVRIDKSISVIPARAFYKHPNITEVICHDGVVRVGEEAFDRCRSLRRVVMLGVEVVEREAFWSCDALTDVQCGKLEIIGDSAFTYCKSLRSINLPSARIVEACAFIDCKALTNVSFGKELESIGSSAFLGCTSLQRITIPLKNGMITEDDIFQGCGNLKHVDLVEGELHETTDALLLEEWKKNMYREIDAINQILPTTPAGNGDGDVYSHEDMGRKGQEVRLWITSVLHKIVQYKVEHHRYLDEAATTLELALPNDIVSRNVLPFLELPSYTFQGED